MTIHQFCQYSILLHFDQFISSLAALVWGSDRGGPVGEAEKTGGRVCVVDPKLKRDGEDVLWLVSRTEASIAQQQSNQPHKLEDLGSSPS